MAEKKERWWNRNFLILWQGQFISDFGNAFFSVALGFWVLAQTGSTAQMGVILACFSLPRVVFGVLAGAVADRLSKKWIIVAADLFRGLLFTLMGLTVIWKVFPFWLIYPLAILAGSSGAFFSPAMGSAIPDIIKTDSLVKANSARSISTTLTELLGNSFGGLLYTLLTAPVLILFNGISFLYAGITQLFMKIPRRQAASEKKHIFQDMAEGFRYVRSNRGVMLLIFTGMCLNFFAVIGSTLFTPLFNQDPALGAAKYGYVMGAITAGALVGMLLLQVLKLQPERRALFFRASMLVMAVLMIALGLTSNYVLMMGLGFGAGLCNAVVNVILQTVAQIAVPTENRGKVFGIFTTVLEGLMPVAMAISGVVAQFAGVRPTIVAAFALMGVFTLPALVSRSFREFICFRPPEPPQNPVEAIAEQA